ncbi:MAG: hypothetical protein ACT4OF_07005, partial [Caulobacteraceae bacterium]
IVTFSPAGFGDWIGASLAAGSGVDVSAAAADNPYVDLPPFSAPMSQQELEQIRGQLAATAAILELAHVTTDAKIERVRTLALTGGMATFAPTNFAAAPREDGLRSTLSVPAPASFVRVEAPVEAYVIEAAPVQATTAPVSYSGGSFDASVPYRDPHLELADLLLAHETF